MFALLKRLTKVSNSGELYNLSRLISLEINYEKTRHLFWGYAHFFFFV